MSSIVQCFYADCKSYADVKLLICSKKTDFIFEKEAVEILDRDKLKEKIAFDSLEPDVILISLILLL
jgi:hypothetical protein